MTSKPTAEQEEIRKLRHLLIAFIAGRLHATKLGLTETPEDRLEYLLQHVPEGDSSSGL